MVNIAWKVIRGHGPYAYLQRSVKSDGAVTSKHLAYLGKIGTEELVPGNYVQVPAVPGFAGGKVRVPMVTGEILDCLKPKSRASVEWMAKQVEEGLPGKAIAAPPAMADKSLSAKARIKTKPTLIHKKTPAASQPPPGKAEQPVHPQRRKNP